MENRQQLFRILKDMLYAPSENELETIFKNAISKCLVKQHPKVLNPLSPFTNDVQSGPCAAGRSRPFMEIIQIISAKVQCV